MTDLPAFFPFRRVACDTSAAPATVMAHTIALASYGKSWLPCMIPSATKTRLESTWRGPRMYLGDGWED